MRNAVKSYKDETYYRAIIVQAAVITVLFHLALLYSFRYSPPVKGVTEAKTQRIIMWNEGGALPRQKAFSNWMEYHDPTLISRPNMVYGYGAAERQRSFRGAIGDLSATGGQFRENVAEFKTFESLSEGERLQFDISSRFVYYRTAGLKTGKKPDQAERPEYPAVKTGSGDFIKGLFADEDTRRKAAAENPAGPTMLKVIFPGRDFIPRVVIEKSCGSAALDTLAIRRFMLDKKIIGALCPDGGGIMYFNIYWKEVK